jgi:hypothetical protein
MLLPAACMRLRALSCILPAGKELCALTHSADLCAAAAAMLLLRVCLCS